MKTASYAVIRYVADPGRNEPLNVGILAWDDAGFELRVDDAATARVVRDHPFLARDALRSLRPMIERSLSDLTPFSPDRHRDLFKSQSGFPIMWSETRLTTLDESRPSPLAHTVERLTARIVRPRHGPGGHGPSR